MPDTAVRFGWVEAATNGTSFVLCIGSANDDGKVKIDVLDVYAPPLSPDAIIKKFADTLRTRGITSVMADRHSSHWAKQALARHCIGFEFCDLVRGDLKREFLALLTAKKIVIPQMVEARHEELRRQVQLLTHKKHGGGADDVLVAVAGVALQAMGKCAPVRVIPDYV